MSAPGLSACSMHMTMPLYHKKGNMTNRTLLEKITWITILPAVIGQYLMPFDIQSTHATCPCSAPLGRSSQPRHVLPCSCQEGFKWLRLSDVTRNTLSVTFILDLVLDRKISVSEDGAVWGSDAKCAIHGTEVRFQGTRGTLGLLNGGIVFKIFKNIFSKKIKSQPGIPTL